MASSLTGWHPHPLRAAVLAGTAVLPLAAFAPSAFAAGDNGDVKVHDTATAVDSQNDDPKVCKFYLDGINFDAGQKVVWSISTQPGNSQVLNGELDMPTGTAQTSTLSLPNGMYKLSWNFMGENGEAKQKVFRVDCPAPSGSPSPVGGTGPGGSASPSGGPSGGPNGGGPTPVGGVAAGAGGASQDLNPAEIAVGGALVAGAGWLAVRRLRRSRR